MDNAETRELQPLQLGAWNYYFIAKFLLFWRDFIGFHPLENMAFAAFLAAPIGKPAWRRARVAIAVPIALGLLYYDSWLPPLNRVLSQANLLSNFSAGYVFELLGRIVSIPTIALLVLGWAVCRITAQYIRIGFVVGATLVALAVSGAVHQSTQPMVAATDSQKTATANVSGNTGDLDAALQDFYAKEALRTVKFAKANGSVPFDIIFIQICSLSWDDMQDIGFDKHPFWNNFDFIFHRFNSAASYSGPAAIRLNRATCGQTSHQALYAQAPDQCLLMPSLKQSGFDSALAFNHDGHFDDFLTLVRKQGLSTTPLTSLDGLTPQLRSFDNSPVFDDLDVLSRWFGERQKSDNARVALFYNTITLHDGSRFVSGPASKLSSQDSYKLRAEKLFSDLTGFLEQIQKSGRRAVVVIIPEHGAARRGDKFQFAGLREIPTPAITTVPVGIKIIGPDANRQGSSSQIDTQISYLGLSKLVSNLIDKSPYGSGGFSPADYVADLPGTGHVAENEGATVMENGGKFFLKLGQDNWQEYSAPGR
ncbi:MAG: cellulose biosynthesis protein BcsG [Burkholderiales bacterium]